MKCCETMVKLISHASMLKNDDVRLKAMPMFTRCCGDCDLAAVDDARHLVMQCPKWREDRSEMMKMIGNVPDGSGQRLLNAQCDISLVLLGKLNSNLTMKQNIRIMIISAKFISKMYNEKIRQGMVSVINLLANGQTRY